MPLLRDRGGLVHEPEARSPIRSSAR
jgi:hypothetical protein